MNGKREREPTRHDDSNPRETLRNAYVANRYSESKEWPRKALHRRERSDDLRKIGVSAPSANTDRSKSRQEESVRSAYPLGGLSPDR
jgi:hypothetical protein